MNARGAADQKARMDTVRFPRRWRRYSSAASRATTSLTGSWTRDPSSLGSINRRPALPIQERGRWSPRLLARTMYPGLLLMIRNRRGRPVVYQAGK